MTGGGEMTVPSEPSSRPSIGAALPERGILPFIGVFDSFSASIAARHYDALFVSGFGFAASYYGLPDIGFITWTDILSFVHRLKAVLPDHLLLVDIDDGYTDEEVAVHVVKRLDRAGASGVVLEDQQRPRRCGHFEGKQLLEPEAYLQKLKRVLDARGDLFVIARTDASEPEDIEERVRAYAAAGADAVLADGIRDLELLTRIARSVDKPVAFNQIAGGKSPMCTLTELEDAGASLAIYSTPCLFAAQSAIEASLTTLKDADGRLPSGDGAVGVRDCTALLEANLEGAEAPPVAP